MIRFLGWRLCLLFLLQSPADPRTLLYTWAVLAVVVGEGDGVERGSAGNPRPPADG